LATGEAAVAVSPAKPSLHYRVLVGAAPKPLVRQLQAAAAAASLNLRQLTFSQTSLANAVGLALPESPANEAVALVDIGFRTSTVSILFQGQLYVTRTVEMGAEFITKSLAENLGVNYAAAEVVARLMPEKVEPKLRKLVSSLSQELRAVIDFFEAQEGKPIAKIYVAGGTARSQLILDSMQHELGHACERLDPRTFMDVSLPPPKAATLEKDAPQLSAAIGAAVTWLIPQTIRLNLLAEAQALAERRRRDPVRRAALVAGLIGLATLAWTGIWWLKLRVQDLELQEARSEMQWLEKGAALVAKYQQQIHSNELTAAALDRQADARALWTPSLNALQQVTVSGVQLLRLAVNRTFVQPPAPTPLVVNGKKVLPKPEPVVERWSLLLDAKNNGEPAAIDAFIEAIGRQPLFHEHLRAVNPVVLVQRLPPQVNPLDPDKTFTRFTVECYFQNHVLDHE